MREFHEITIGVFVDAVAMYGLSATGRQFKGPCSKMELVSMGPPTSKSVFSNSWMGGAGWTEIIRGQRRERPVLHRLVLMQIIVEALQSQDLYVSIVVGDGIVLSLEKTLSDLSCLGRRSHRCRGQYQSSKHLGERPATHQ